jgi:hypothetical protein
MNEEVYNLSLSVPGTGQGELVNVTVRIEVRDGNIVSLKGSGEGNNYEGTLTLRLVSGSALDAAAPMCIICDPNCHVVVPCP